jgi:D-aminopeptidase
VPGYACRPWRSRKHLCARGFATLIRGDDIRTGVTAILPHAGNLFQKKVPGAVFVGNAFGKLVGSTQVNELGEIETPILLTSTISGGRVADALISYVLKLPGDEDVKSVNPLVGETNDGYLNDIRSRPITEEDVFSAIASAKRRAGGRMRGGRRDRHGYTVGVLVQTNFGGFLSIAGVPVAKELGNGYLINYLQQNKGAPRTGRQIPRVRMGRSWW